MNDTPFPNPRGLTGYMAAEYVASFIDFGTPIHHPSGAGFLLREIGASGKWDAMGVYPLLCAVEGCDLAGAVEELSSRAISLVSVMDPLGHHTQNSLSKAFPDLTRAYKEHYVVELAKDPFVNVSHHHLRNLKKGERGLLVRRHDDPSRIGDQWKDLYANLIKRHGIRGFLAFSDRSFATLLKAPGIVAFSASKGADTVGIVLCAESRPKAYYHLGAYSDEGYSLNASFALFGHIIEHYRQDGFEFLDLGGGAGTPSEEDGLVRFKRGWTKTVKTAWLCGRVFARVAYDSLSARANAGTAYFPSYRAPSGALK